MVSTCFPNVSTWMIRRVIRQRRSFCVHNIILSVINERSVTIGTDIIFSLGSHTNTIGDVMIRGRS